jgi:hypothetical protein
MSSECYSSKGVHGVDYGKIRVKVKTFSKAFGYV